jgi:hypothetical protein
MAFKSTQEETDYVVIPLNLYKINQLNFGTINILKK